MKPEHLKDLVDRKRRITEPLTPQEIEAGFKGWYSSKYLPHFDSSGTRQYITYRLADSLPAEQKGEWEALLKIEDNLEKQRKLEKYLDLGYGDCHLRDARIAEVVQENLWHFDGVKYHLLAWVIMPNHVHVLVELGRVPLGPLVKSWKSYTAKEANKVLRRQGMFWEDDYFDRYIRDEEHYCRVVRYIENNPVKAGLVRKKEDWPWCSARYRNLADPSGKTLNHPANRGGDSLSPSAVPHAAGPTMG